MVAHECGASFPRAARRGRGHANTRAIRSGIRRRRAPEASNGRSRGQQGYDGKRKAGPGPEPMNTVLCFLSCFLRYVCVFCPPTAFDWGPEHRQGSTKLVGALCETREIFHLNHSHQAFLQLQERWVPLCALHVASILRLR
jgi:hypothetical protein